MQYNPTDWISSLSLPGGWELTSTVGRYAVLGVSFTALAFTSRSAGLDPYIISVAGLAAVAVFASIVADQLLTVKEECCVLSERLRHLESHLSKYGQLPGPMGGEELDSASLHSENRGLPPGARIAIIGTRTGIIFKDGSVILPAMAGYRQFASEFDARQFVDGSSQQPKIKA